MAAAHDVPVLNGIHDAEPSTPEPVASPTPSSSASAIKSPKSPSVDLDAQNQVITSLRAQIQDLFSQVTQLNSKLVSSYDRVSDLEDELHMASSSLRLSSLKVSQLELERTQHLSALNTGLLVEKEHVTNELNRLMEKATEEAAQRGQAESARIAIEKELDDLSASLFGQANTMVAEARFNQSLSEKKVEESQVALKTAEEAVKGMQRQMQALLDERERSIRRNGAWVDSRGEQHQLQVSAPMTRLLGSHLPYQEFLLFVAHLRSVHMSSPNQPPAMSTLLPLPFLARLITEDSDPTLRLDLAPSLNWLSRRSVMTAIHNGQLTIEPVSTTYLLNEATHPSGGTTIPGLNSSGNNISCALCGVPIFASSFGGGRPPLHPNQQNQNQNQQAGGGWSSSIFKRPSLSSISSPPSSPPSQSNSNSKSKSKATKREGAPAPLTEHPTQIFVFRVYSAVSPTMAGGLPSISSISSTFSSSSSSSSPAPPPIHPHSHSHSSQHAQTQTQTHKHTPSTLSSTSTLSTNSTLSTLSTASLTATTTYPLCTTGWCLNRLRMTCEIWGFVRRGVVDKVWDEEVSNLPSPPPAAAPAPPAGVSNSSSAVNGAGAGLNAANGLPPIPPRRRGLWGMASALSERAGWASSTQSSSSSSSANSATSPPPTPEKKPALPPRANPPPPTTSAPPPLPKRNAGRSSGGGGMSTPRGSLDETRSSTPTPGGVGGGVRAGEGSENENENENEKEKEKGERVKAEEEEEKEKEEKPEEQKQHNQQTPKPPTQIPLPDSRPSTPTNPNPNLPARPARRPMSANLSSTNSNANGVNGGVAPPVPRRAAARGNTGGMGGSRPGTPGGGGGGGSPKDEKGREGGMVFVVGAEKTEGGNEEEKEKGEKEEAQTEKMEKEKEKETASTPTKEPANANTTAPTNEPNTNANTGEGTNHESTPSPSNEKATPSSPTNETSSPSPPEKQPSNEAQNHKTPSNSENSNSENKDNEIKSKEKQEPTDPTDTDTGVYIGNATWEERTWKEFVKLKEEMFWGRVGRVRVGE